MPFAALPDEVLVAVCSHLNLTSLYSLLQAFGPTVPSLRLLFRDRIRALSLLFAPKKCSSILIKTSPPNFGTSSPRALPELFTHCAHFSPVDFSTICSRLIFAEIIFLDRELPKKFCLAPRTLTKTLRALFVELLSCAHLYLDFETHINQFLALRTGRENPLEIVRREPNILQEISDAIAEIGALEVLTLEGYCQTLDTHSMHASKLQTIILKGCPADCILDWRNLRRLENVHVQAGFVFKEISCFPRGALVNNNVSFLSIEHVTNVSLLPFDPWRSTPNLRQLVLYGTRIEASQLPRVLWEFLDSVADSADFFLDITDTFIDLNQPSFDQYHRLRKALHLGKVKQSSREYVDLYDIEFM